MTRLRLVGRFVISPDHPSLPGHFPGQPIVPGVVLIDNAVSLLLAAIPSTTLSGITCKFTAAVSPGQVVDVAGSDAHDGCVDFQCTVAGTTVTRGTIQLRPANKGGATPASGLTAQ